MSYFNMGQSHATGEMHISIPAGGQGQLWRFFLFAQHFSGRDGDICGT